MRTLSASVTNHPPQLSLGRNIVFFLPLFIRFLHSLIIRCAVSGSHRCPLQLTAVEIVGILLTHILQRCTMVTIGTKWPHDTILLLSDFFVTVKTVCHRYKPWKKGVWLWLRVRIFFFLHKSSLSFPHTARNMTNESFLGGVEIPRAAVLQPLSVKDL